MLKVLGGIYIHIYIINICFQGTGSKTRKIEKKMNTNNSNELFLSYCYSTILCLSLERVYKVFNSEVCDDAPSHPGWGVFISFLHLTNSCKRAL